MKILQLEINDLKRIAAVEINPENGKPIILTGDNGQGKSSVLDSILLALENRGLDDPIRHGRPSGSVKITLGEDKAEYILERKVTKKGSYLTLTTANGLPVQKAQTFINGLLGNYAFDPLEFTRLKPKQQVEALKEAAGLNFEELDAQRAEFYAERTQVGRDGKEASAALAGISEPGKDIPETELSATALVDQLNKLEEGRRDLETAIRAADDADKKRREAKDEVVRLKELLASAETALDVATRNASKSADQRDFLRGAVATEEQVAEVREAIGKIDETNEAVRNARRYRELDARTKKLRSDYATLARRIEEIDEQKAEAVKNANLPIDGLELSDDGVLMDGNFFSQLSTGEQIRISALVAMSQNPELRIIIIREGALMNKANLTMLSDLANECGYQLWIEKFQETPGDEGFHIIDGSIAFEDGKQI